MSSSEAQIRVRGAKSAEHIVADETGRAHTYVKRVPFCLAMYAIGRETNPQRGRLLRMSARAVSTALAGGPVGGDFIGNTMTAFSRHSDELKRVGLEVSMDAFFEARDESEPTA